MQQAGRLEDIVDIDRLARLQDEGKVLKYLARIDPPAAPGAPCAVAAGPALAAFMGLIRARAEQSSSPRNLPIRTW